MLRSSFFRIGIARICAAVALGVVTATALPAVAAAQEPRPPVDLNTSVSGSTIDYTIDNVPNRRDTFPVIRGECTTAVVNVLVAAPILAPAAIDTLSGREPDVFALLQRLIAEGALTAGPRIQLASSTGQISGSFTDIPRGVYVVGTICNINPLGGQFDPNLFDFSPSVVVDTRSGSSAPVPAPVP
ncbi:hypothetical protein IU438_06425 [Nocardia cyriacigeorgica]|uniref:hypothetical protein n=1 Tax=Nocardia cyriacigeorgica TaxID=135487 RepID=UPI0018957D82|nr:hypothetical protein [Nocardia cyriacigeorgica]MBF6160835.1 hypothetical protein [Nocardia cyriacigeorgica]MBF6201581.1 hypothetical protein [Nocardia cyriacigeorgica]MBF6318832.1 hypothetical protein [Nocardia cyriacigeorgica]MBF6395423.1 hypothetical protein [Nocardia cyriacigeorgica]MBF6401055.1 hypothetical protein [Nocardia cyriacigeorgica]